MIEPREIEYNGIAFTIRVPLGGDWLAVSALEGHERSLVMILRCVERDGAPAWQSVQDLERVPMALLLKFDQILGELLEYDVPDPTSARCADCPAPLA